MLQGRRSPLGPFAEQVAMMLSIGHRAGLFDTMWGWETVERMLKAAGFSAVERHTLPHDPMNVWFVSHKG